MVSLVQAGLLPRLQSSFDVWGPTRVNQAPRELSSAANRYVLSAMQGLEEEVPEEYRRDPAELAVAEAVFHLAILRCVCSRYSEGAAGGG